MATLETKKKTVTLEQTGFQSPDMAVENLTKRLDAYIVKLKQKACVNAVISKKDPSYDTNTQEVDPGDVIFSDEHCKNQRRNGSKYCQVCSDKHNGKA